MAKKKSSKTTKEAGIKELVWVDPNTLDDNPLNWRKHPARQKDAISASIKANGWSDTLTYNETTGKLIDGHARKAIAIKEGIEAVPVLVGNWTPEQEKHLLATLDPLAAMAETDAEALQSLTESLQADTEQIQSLGKKDKDILNQLNQDIDAYAFDVQIGQASETFLGTRKPISSEEKEKIISYEIEQEILDSTYSEEIIETQLKDANTVLFKSSNPFGIPDLLEDRLSQVHPESTWDRTPESEDEFAWYCYSGQPFPKTRNGGILGFYTDDYRFEVCWNKKEAFLNKLVEQKWSAVVSPDFSTWNDWPFAVRLHNVYRSRWCARYWQEFGIHIIPSISWGGDPDKMKSWAFETLPKGCPYVAIQCRTQLGNKKAWKVFRDTLEVVVDTISPEGIIIYGGIELGKNIEHSLPSGVEYHMLDAYMTKRRHLLSKKKD